MAWLKDPTAYVDRACALPTAPTTMECSWGSSTATTPVAPHPALAWGWREGVVAVVVAVVVVAVVVVNELVVAIDDGCDLWGCGRWCAVLLCIVEATSCWMR